MPIFYAQEDKYGYPIPGTMQATNKTVATVPARTNIVTIPAQDVVSTKVHPKGLRFFVRKDRSGNIIPNSLFISTKAPSTGLYYEFKIS